MTELERLIIAAQEAEKLKKLVSVEILILADKAKMTSTSSPQVSQAVLCPVCEGVRQFYTPPPAGIASIVGFYTICYGCGGLGWV